MNIEEFRAMVAEEKRQAESGTTPEQPPVEPVQPESTQTEVVETQVPPAQEPTQPEAPQVFDVNGTQVTLDELQRGYLRQSDYTKKTQEIARRERELQSARTLMEQVQANPEIARQVGYNPEQARIDQMQAELYDLRLAQEITTLSTKYADFEVNDVIQFALDRKMENLEDAYLLNKQYRGSAPSVPAQTVPNQAQSSIDVEALKAQIRAELQTEQNTSTIIGGAGTPPTQPQAVQLSEAERKVARAFRMTDEQYALSRQQ